MAFIAKISCSSYSTVYVYVHVYAAIFEQGAHVEVTRTKFFVVNGIFLLSLWNIQLTFER